MQIAASTNPANPPSALLLGNPGAVPILAGSEIVAAAGVIAFACNVFVNVQPNLAPSSPRAAKP